MHPLNPEKTATANLRRPPPPDTTGQCWAWFLDVDGTLLDIEQHPDHVSADSSLLDLLAGLTAAYGGAVALISGRSLAQLDEIFGSRAIAAAASHGLEQRMADGSVYYAGHALPARCSEQIDAFVRHNEGLLMEQKPFSISVHYRARPQLEAEVLLTLEKILAGLDNGFRIQRGKMVAEIMPAAADKGSAIRSFMKMPPFKGRRPVFAGDDVTDEAGFAAVNQLSGLSIRIGDADQTCATWHLDDVRDLRKWLRGSLKPASNGEECE